MSWKTCMRLAVSALAVFLFVRYWDSIEGFFGLLFSGLLAIFAGLTIAYVVNIPMRFFERHLPGETGDGTRNRTLSLLLAVACIVAVLLFVITLVAPQLVQAVVTLVKEAPTIISAITGSEVVKSIIPGSLISQVEGVNWSQLVSDAASWLQSGVASSLPRITSLVGQIGAWFMGVVLAFWFLSEKDGLGAHVHRLLKTYVGEEFDKRFRRAAALVDGCFHGYIVGQSLEAAIFGVIVALASTLMGISNGLMLGALVGAMSLIPMVGAVIGAVLGALMMLATSWQQALVFLVLFFIVQQIEANFIYMRVVGKHVGLTGMWPLIGVTLGAALFGIAGAFVGVPLTAAAFRVVEADLERREGLPDGEAAPLKKLHEKIVD